MMGKEEVVLTDWGSGDRFEFLQYLESQKIEYLKKRALDFISSPNIKGERGRKWNLSDWTNCETGS